jgi:hypothetical protein
MTLTLQSVLIDSQNIARDLPTSRGVAVPLSCLAVDLESDWFSSSDVM